MNTDPIVLGIHIGHDSSCAIVKGRELLAAVQTERITRKKHDGSEVLDDTFPIESCLAAANISLDSIDLIVSSFQAASPAGFGLHQPLIHPSFNVFDVASSKHFVLSHHLAHAYCALGCSGKADSLVLVSDLAGSSTEKGEDYFIAFDEWRETLTTWRLPKTLKTECLSIYHAKGSRHSLLEREFCIAHNAPESFIHNACSLYNNISQCVFRKDHAHGQLMALAAFGVSIESQIASDLSPQDLVEINGDTVIFRNDWQHRIQWFRPIMEYARLANSCQKAFQQVLVSYARRAARYAFSHHLVGAGGAFLNVLANSEIRDSHLFKDFFVPSAPHDAGIAAGCAFYGSFQLKAPVGVHSKASARLGRSYQESEFAKCFQDNELFVKSHKSTSADIAKRLHEGQIIARVADRAEFGPRALGARSLLASPLKENNKARLNQIKGRQAWRPVAPFLLADYASEVLDHASSSPYMSFAHRIKDECVNKLPALNHPDATTRAQTLSAEDDPELSHIILEFRALSGFAVLCNTSLNGIDEPIVETSEDAFSFFLSHRDVDALLCGDKLVTRADPWEQIDCANSVITLSFDTIMHILFLSGKPLCVLTRCGKSYESSESLFKILQALGGGCKAEEALAEIGGIESEAARELYTLAELGFVKIERNG